MGIGPVPRQTLDALHQLIEEITVADADKVYSVTMRPDEALRLEDVRTAAVQLDIPRVLAYIGDSTPTNPGYGPMVTFGLGTIYENARAWQREICRAKYYSQNSRDRQTENVPPEDWRVTELHVYGSADAIRELRRGVVLPPLSLIEGGAEGHPRAPEGMIAYETQQIAQKTEVHANYDEPRECRQYFKDLDAPILAGDPIFPSREEAALDPAELLRRRLSERAADVAVTLRLEFRQDMNIEMLADLVRRHDIDGLSTEIQPISNDRILMMVQLSIHGAPLDEKIERLRCDIESAKDKLPNPADDWYSNRAQISVTVQKAWQVVTDQSIYRATFVADFEPAHIRRLEKFYERREMDIRWIPRDQEIPAGCQQYIQHSL